MRRYVNALLAIGFQVFVICIGDDLEGSMAGAEKRLRIFRLRLKKKRSSLSRRLFEYLVFEAYALCVAAYVFVRYRVKIYHIHTLPDFLVFSCIVPRVFGARVILDFHELFPEFMMQYKPRLNYDSFLIRMILLQERLAFHFATDIVAFHDPAKEILSKRVICRKPISVIMNGVDPAEMLDIARRFDEKFRIVYNGTINFNLNLGIVVDALAYIKKNRPEVYSSIEFDLYGDGPDLANVLEKARDSGVEKVYYKGRYTFDEMMKELSCAAACVLPPKKDIYSDLYYSIKLTEMIYLKVPVIATRLNTYLKYYPEDCLYYFNSGDVRELSSVICYVYNNPNQVKERVQRAFSKYLNYSWPIMKKRYVELIERND